MVGPLPVSKISLRLTCDTRLARMLLDTLAPLVLDGRMDEGDLRKIVSSAVRIEGRGGGKSLGRWEG
jgi:hypothetical protein